LTLPDAAKPADVTGADDHRTLGFAVERIELFHRERPSVEPADRGAETMTAEPGGSASSEAAKEKPEGLAAQHAQAESRTATPPAEAAAELVEAAASSAPEPELPPRELMLRFESIGENCEFGLVQRRCGAEPLGLFRFASAPLPKLLAGLAARFEGLGDPDNLEVELSPNGREYLVTDKKFQLLYHAWVLADEMTAQEVHRREVRRLPLLIRKFLEDLSEAKKIFVYHGMEPLSDDDANRLLADLRRYGRNTLLWVEAADGEHPPGSVMWRGEGLLKAHIDRFAPGEDAHDLSLDCWIEICREAYRLYRIDAGASRRGAVPASAAAQ
jgi:hypothetical protein